MKEPKIRFKGFSGEWEKVKIQDICSKANSTHSENSLGENTGNYPIFGANGYLQNITTFDFNSPYIGIIKDGSGVGRSQLYPAFSSILGTMQYILPKEDINISFLAYLFETIDFSMYINGSSIPHIYFKDYCEQDEYIPSIAEQRAIASYFQHLDALIQSTTKKIESLKQVKAASLQSMFPQEGETTPRVRFKGFEGEWEKVQFSKLYEPSSIKNKTFGADKIISVANMYFKPVSYISDEEYLKSYNVMNLGDIAFEGNKSKNYAHGRFVENTIGDGIVSHVFIVLKPISKQYDLQFWKYLINYERIMGPILLRSTKHSTMMTDLVVSDFLKESVLVPSYEEQKAIGIFLKTLDRQITLQTQRLEKLKQIKSACLDNMFV